MSRSLHLPPYFWLLALGFMLLVVAATFPLIYQNLTRGSTDLYPTWQGARLFWEEGISPYDEQVGQQSQVAIYGHPAEGDEDEFQFVYPFHSIFHIGPLALLDFQLAAAIYMQGLLLGLLLVLSLVCHALGWLPKPLTLGLLILWTVLGYFSVRGLLLAQPGLAAYLLHMLAFWAILRGRDRLAGAALALSTLKPQLGFLLLPILLIWAWQNGRASLVYSFTLSFALLMGLSFLLLPSWFGDWIDRVFNYAGYSHVTSPATYYIAHAFGLLPDGLANTLYAFLAGLLLLSLLWLWLPLWRGRGQEAWLWAFFYTQTITLLIAPRVATTSYVELLPVLYLTVLLWEKRRRFGWIYAGGLLSLLGFWLLHIATVPAVGQAGYGREAPVVYVIFPLMIFVLLLYNRREYLAYSAQLTTAKE